VSTRTLQVTLPDDLDAEIVAAVAAGEYASTEDVIADAVAEWGASRRLDSSLDREELRRLWREGIESGRGRSLSIDDLKREAALRFARGRAAIARRPDAAG
jgi:antitoxin ParD1/3/4